MLFTSEKTGFKAYYDKKSHLPQVTKRLIHDSFFASVKVPELAGNAAGG